ncbi:hypothetical protein ZOD2009_00775 [Haladaptatus paucihalophilus DX253]|uniref:DUF5518 domain-containing protein n=1 Tax=Haladaptatus paucihalophilus DX253 TaxID=797209 RepID=E7QNX9_HALPU|nr:MULTISPECIES: DUF5518 domain-containing protein [Haladaptatus]EFW93632.1 hypothetical protein ZOD2009_00775 [Haladaptatus paucihalophilus DX253]ODR82743.1 hypothetical protein BG842_16585 [Haladaptatus sp. W1]SHL46125.1 hypothetical protein SAMN05444342_3859 [Haladaptatus paucihalophilus DX253]
MDFKAKAIAYGIVATIIVGLLSGAGIPFTDMTLPVVGAGLTGIIGGLVAGYVSGTKLDDGALNGGVATAAGAIVALVILTIGGLLAGPVPAMGLFAFGVLFVVVAAIPGIVGGALGSWLNGRSERRAAARPA